MYSFTSRVRYSEVDEGGTLTPVALLNYLQDCSLFQTESLGFGPAHAEEVGLRWLLSTWQIEIERLPRFCDEVRTATWASGFTGLFAKRNFTMEDVASGELLVRADSQWFMYSDEAGRPVRAPQSEVDAYARDLAEDVPLPMPPMGRKIRVPQGGEPAQAVPVGTSLIDSNHHVNNAQYVSIALGLLPRDLVAGMRNLDVQYVNAARLGDVLHPRVVEFEPEDDAGSVGQGAARPGAIVSLEDAEGNPYAVVRVR